MGNALVLIGAAVDEALVSLLDDRQRKRLRDPRGQRRHATSKVTISNNMVIGKPDCVKGRTRNVRSRRRNFYF